MNTEKEGKTATTQINKLYFGGKRERHLSQQYRHWQITLV